MPAVSMTGSPRLTTTCLRRLSHKSRLATHFGVRSGIEPRARQHRHSSGGPSVACDGESKRQTPSKATKGTGLAAAYVRQFLDEWVAEQKGSRGGGATRISARAVQLSGEVDGNVHLGLARFKTHSGQVVAHLCAAVMARVDATAAESLHLSWSSDPEQLDKNGDGHLEGCEDSSTNGSECALVRSSSLVELQRVALPGLKAELAVGSAAVTSDDTEDLHIRIWMACGGDGAKTAAASATLTGMRKREAEGREHAGLSEHGNTKSGVLVRCSGAVRSPPPVRHYTSLFRGDAHEAITLTPIAHISSRYTERYGTPRQAVLADATKAEVKADEGGITKNDTGRAELQLASHIPREALTALEGFDYIWVITELHLNRVGNPMARGGHWNPMVRPPPVLGLSGCGDQGQEGASQLGWKPKERRKRKVGVLATRAPHRPNPIGLSAVRVLSVDVANGVVHLGGVDLLDGTPVLDLKPYVPYADAFPDARAGWTEEAS